MGLTFTAFLMKQAQGNQDKIETCFDEIMEQNGYERSQSKILLNDTDCAIRQYQPNDKDWTLFVGAGCVFHEMGVVLAGKCKSDVLLVDCVDSDFLEYEWYKSADDVRKGCYDLDGTGQIFAEELLPRLGADLGYDFGENAVVFMDAVCEKAEPDCVYVYVPKPAPVEEQPPKLEWAGHMAAPLKPEVEYWALFANKGGEGAGVQVQLSGPFAEHDAMTFSDVRIQAPDGTVYEGKYIGKYECSDGYMYCYNFSELTINPFVKGEQWERYQLKLIPHGDARYGLDFYYAVIPLEKGIGFRETNCGVDYHEEFIEEWNEHNPDKLCLEDFEYDEG